MKSNKLISVVILGFLLFFVASWWENSLSKKEGEFIKLGKLSFHTSLDQGINESKNLSKPVFMYFRSETCYWCKRFEEEVLSDKQVIDVLNANFVLISIDISEQKKIALKFGVRSTPFMIFFNKDGEQISRIPGYLQVDELMEKVKNIQFPQYFQELTKGEI